jgi:hypothetical protein
MPNGGSWKSGNPPSMFPVNMNGAFTKEKKNNGFFYVKKQMAYN